METKEINKALAEARENICKYAADPTAVGYEVKKIENLYENKLIANAPMNVGAVVKSIHADAYEMGLTEQGAYYKTRGGFMIFVTPRMSALYETIADITTRIDEYKKEWTPETFEGVMEIMTTIMNLPTFAFSDKTFAQHIHQEIVKYVDTKIEEAEKELIEENIDDVRKNATYQQAAEAIHNATQKWQRSE